MQARRILLFLGALLLLTAAVASLVPVSESERRDREQRSPADAKELPPQSRPEEDDVVEVGIDAAAPPRTRAVDADAHVILKVRAEGSGQVAIEGLGRMEPVEPRVPAVFDLFTDRPGRFDIVYTPAEGAERRLGTLVVREGAASPAARRRGAAASHRVLVESGSFENRMWRAPVSSPGATALAAAATLDPMRGEHGSGGVGVRRRAHRP